MAKDSSELGRYIRDEVLPSGMTVTKAAERLGVGRPALSSLINGRASLSPKMSQSLESVFGADTEVLGRLQRRREANRRPDAAPLRAYVPSFLSIKSRDIEQWASTMDARTHLPVLLRKLVHATAPELDRVDFAGGDNSQRKGWDGLVESRIATAWVPKGRSVWEFGTGQDPWRKAEGDYAKRLRRPPSERAEVTFVFVTPRNWPGKREWAARKEGLAHGWKGVRAYDADDLEQWLEEAVAAPIWFGERLPIILEGIKTLDRCWSHWAEASDPYLTEAIFAPGVAASAEGFRSWLEQPPERPFVVAADSNGEALAFLACLFRHKEIAPQWGDRAVAFESASSLKLLTDSAAPFIPILANADVQQAVPGLHKRKHCVTLCARNAVHIPIDASPDLLAYRDFEAALSDMGMVEDVDRWARESGRSPTILRRRLSQDPVVRTPPWAADPTLARRLVPICLVGAWHAQSIADRELLAELAGCAYEAIEEQVARFRALDDAPVWSLAQHHGVTSKVDALYGVARVLTQTDLFDFLSLAEYVLAELDPAQELAAEDRWAAVLHGKVRDHSKALRNGICETLVLLAIHGNGLFRAQLGVDLEAEVSSLVAKVLTPMTAETLQSQLRDLPVYAEAAPDTILALLEKDCCDGLAIQGLIAPTPGGVFDDCPRAGLLWALECIAWNPAHLSRVALLLAKLSTKAIDDNWSNTPFSSLAAILRSWMPKTAATLAERMDVLELVNRRFPDIGWQLCLGEIALGPRLATDNYRPRWRSDASGAGKVVTRREAAKFIGKAVELMLSRRSYDAATLGDLVAHLGALSASDQSVVWDLVDDWARQAPDEEIAELRELVRRSVLTRRGHRGASARTVERAKEVYERLVPSDPVVRHQWLFANGWVDESWDEIVEDNRDFDARDRRIDTLRVLAMSEIWDARGLEGVVALVKSCNAADTIGHYVATCASDPTSAQEIALSCLSREWADDTKADAFLRGYIAAAANPAESNAVLRIAERLDSKQAERVFRCAPFHEATWRLLDEVQDDVRDGYWQRVVPHGWTFTESECVEIIDRLLLVARPRAAFSAMTLQWRNIETSRLRRLITDVAFVDAEDRDYIPKSYDIERALEELGRRPGIRREEMAALEFAFIAALEHSDYGVPNLERMVTESPEFFVRVLAVCYRRRDEGLDPEDWRTEDEGSSASAAQAAYRLLGLVNRIPGTKADGSIDPDRLSEWLSQARRLCANAGRAEVGDIQMGEILAKAPSDEGGAWPCEAVAEGLERNASEHVAQGFEVGTINSRGVVVRGEGGAQERELVAKYRRWAKLRRSNYPFVSSLLGRIADSYDREASRWDAEMQLERRLPS